ncbi:helix-turn-helix transcriptional regulator [Jiangella mangrovi]|uniref:DNA-binding protein n=1 Tax=Jiangella mangrovi TaxID=1524084 RepID=A0A7W9GXY2_9ACTN|nr:helix-turn-helix domain-containing protein [Jiangella mangrovi]MBB5791791.1 hypothetical protein [Jiangella mangrovi]
MDSNTGAVLTPRELASRWRVSAGHLANLRARGEGIRYIKLGACVRYRLMDVLEHEAASVVEPVAA